MDDPSDPLARLLANHFARSSGPVAFLDESYREEAFGESPFYLVAALVVDSSELNSARAKLVAACCSARWHTTEEFQRQRLREISQMVSVLGEFDAQKLIGTVVMRDSMSLEAARREALAQTSRELSDLGTRLIVYERRRTQKAKNADAALFTLLKRHEFLPRDVRAFPAHPGIEPLLWASDLMAWSMRRSLALGDNRWINPLRSSLEVLLLGGEAEAEKKKPGLAAAIGPGSESPEVTNGAGGKRSSLNSMTLKTDIEQVVRSGFADVRSGPINPGDLSRWLAQHFPA